MHNWPIKVRVRVRVWVRILHLPIAKWSFRTTTATLIYSASCAGSYVASIE